MMGSQTPALASEHRHLEEQGVDLFGTFLLLVEYRRFIFLVTLVFTLAGIVLAFTLTPTYRAEALILPPNQQQSSLTSMMGQLGALASLGGGGAGGSSLLKNPADMYIGILQSRTIADQLIEQFHLQTIFKTKTLLDTRVALAKQVKFETDKGGLIRISVVYRDPVLATSLANGYVDSLHQMNSHLAITEAGQRRLFFDQQLTEEKAALTDAENQLRQTQEKTGLIQLSGQAGVIIRSIADLRAQIASREVQLEAIRTYATEQNPDTVRLQNEIGTLREQLSKLENSQQSLQPGDIQVPAGRVPEASLEYARRYRDMRYHEELFELLSRQFEAARIDEAKSVPLIQVVDRAVPPDKKSGPPRKLITLGFFFGGFILACLTAFSRSAFRNWESTPLGAQRMEALRALLRSRQPQTRVRA